MKTNLNGQTMNKIVSATIGRVFGNKTARQLDLKTLAKLYPPRPEFHPLVSSPHVELREYHKNIVDYSSCPTCLEIDDKLLPEEWNDIHAIPGGTSRSEPAPKSRLRPVQDCPKCGFPTHCNHEHQEQDDTVHKDICGTLRQWNEDEHDARSPRKFWEMTFPGRQERDALLNFTSWPYLLATRKFPRPVMQNAVTQRHISRFLTYPYTIAAILNNPWAYCDEKQTEENFVTEAGWHLLSSISHALEVGTKSAMKNFDQHRGPKSRISFTGEPTAPTLTHDPFRIFILGPRVECQLPAFVWEQLSMTFPGVPFRLYFIGPESQPSDLPITSNSQQFTRHRNITPITRVHTRPVTSKNSESETVVDSLVLPVTVNMRMEYIRANYEDVHETFGPFQKNRDVFVLFNSGIGHPITKDQWKPAIDKVLKTRCLTIFTSLNKKDQERDVEAIKENHDGDYLVALRPTFNKFSSMRPDITADAVHDPEEWVYCNWGVFALRGIGTEVGDRNEDVQLKEAGEASWFKWSW